MSSSTKPYLLRAVYEWCLDNEQTPHIVVWVNQHTCVPMQYVRNNEIVLNIGPTATHNLNIDNDWINFSARFAGVAQDIWIPVGHVVSLFARESGEGMGFEVEPYVPENEKSNDAAPLRSNHDSLADTEDTNQQNDASKPKEEQTKKNKKGLKLVK